MIQYSVLSNDFNSRFNDLFDNDFFTTCNTFYSRFNDPVFDNYFISRNHHMPYFTEILKDLLTVWVKFI